MSITSKLKDLSIGAHLTAGAAVILILVAGTGGWAATTEIAGAVLAPGTVIIDSNVKKVQHQTGGILHELLVVDGDKVKAGQVVARLDKTQAQASVEILKQQLDELMVRKARVEAERDGAEKISIPQELSNRADEEYIAILISGQSRLFSLRRDSRAGEKAQLIEQTAQSQQEVSGLEAQVASKVREIDWIRQELDRTMSLWQKNLIPFLKFASLQRDLAKQEGDHGLLIAQIARTKNRIAEIRLKILQIEQDLRTESSKELSTIQAEIAEKANRKLSADDTLSRTDILSPQDGTIHKLAVHTVGGVVSPGETMMMVVPSRDTLDVEAKVPPHMIDQVHVGQPAMLRFTAFSQGTTPEIDGHVVMVSADLVEDPTNHEKYYTARVSIPEWKLRELGLTLVPGMPVETLIQTDERTVISYLVKPLSDQLNRAFRER